MTRILSLHLPTFPTDRIARREAAGAATLPLATVAAVKGAQRIEAVDRLAAGAVRPGMGLADARAVCPTLRIADADPAGEAATLRGILDWSRRFTPLAAIDAPDGLLLDITGAAHLFDGEAGVIAAAESGLAAQGFAATAGVADTPEAAWALARFGAVRVASPGRPAIAALAEPLPLAALRLEPATVDALAQAGLRRIGDLLIRPRAPVAARFGSALFRRLDGLLGLGHTPITPSFPVPPFVAERRFASAIARIEGVEATIAILAESLCGQLAAAGQGARRVEALFFRVDGAVKSLQVGTSHPLRDPPRLARLFREKLAMLGEDGLDTGYGFDLIRLAALSAEPFDTHQAGLAAEPDDRADLADLVDRLAARLGATRVLRLHDADRHLPEAAAVAASALGEGLHEADIIDDGRDRPLRLFERPEPIDAMAAVPDGPPARFRWRRALHEIAAIEGPERIAPPWWTAPAPIRDYFHAEDREGRRFWLYREGLYTDPARPRWFLHGLW